MTLSIIGLIANLVCVLCSVIWVITSITSSRRMDKIEFILSGHIGDIHEIKYKFELLEKRIDKLNIRLNDLDNKTTNNSSDRSPKSD